MLLQSCWTWSLDKKKKILLTQNKLYAEKALEVAENVEYPAIPGKEQDIFFMKYLTSSTKRYDLNQIVSPVVAERGFTPKSK